MATSGAAPTLPTLEFSRGVHSSNSSVTSPSETTTISERHDSRLTSPRSSLSSCSTDSLRTNPSRKTAKRVRFEESVCCSYFDIHAEIPPPQPTLQRKSSFWGRFKQKNISADQVGTMPPNLQALKRQNFSMDLLEMDSRIVGKASARFRIAESYSVQQPLRESAGRKYSSAETRACWRADTVTAKGDWGDLLSNPRQSRLIA